MPCPECGYRILPVGEGIYKCQFCETYFKDKNGVLVPYSYTVTPYADELRKRMIIEGLGKVTEKSAPVQEATGVFTMTDFELKWVNGVSSRLIPVRAGEGRNVMELRNKYRQRLIDVLQGKLDVEDWIADTCVERKKKEIEVLMILEGELSKHPEIRYDKNALALRNQLRERISGLR